MTTSTHTSSTNPNPTLTLTSHHLDELRGILHNYIYITNGECGDAQFLYDELNEYLTNFHTYPGLVGGDVPHTLQSPWQL